jgi:hypothetical protein
MIFSVKPILQYRQNKKKIIGAQLTVQSFADTVCRTDTSIIKSTVHPPSE